MKKRIFSEEGRFLITYITLDVSYGNDKKVRIRKIHKDAESEELKKPKYKSDNEIYIYDNQIDLDMFSTYKPEINDIFKIKYLNRKSLKSEEFETQLKELSRYGGDFFRIEKYFPERRINLFKHGLAIYVSMKFPDEQLIDNLCSILHELCYKHLKTSIMITGKDSIICRIDDCHYSEDVLKNFLEEFVITIEKTILREI